MMAAQAQMHALALSSGRSDLADPMGLAMPGYTGGMYANAYGHPSSASQLGPSNRYGGRGAGDWPRASQSVLGVAPYRSSGATLTTPSHSASRSVMGMPPSSMSRKPAEAAGARFGDGGHLKPTSTANNSKR